jgi:hypothetical protein
MNLTYRNNAKFKTEKRVQETELTGGPLVRRKCALDCSAIEEEEKQQDEEGGGGECSRSFTRNVKRRYNSLNKFRAKTFPLSGRSFRQQCQ